MGLTVVVNYSGSEQEAKQVVEAIVSAGGKAKAWQANFSKIDDIRRLFQEVSDHFGQLDILVNNAGTGIVAAIADITEADYDKVFDLNVRGILFAMQEAARCMNDGGRIINISFTTTIYPEPGMAVYAASKAAIKLFTAVMAKGVGERGITVNTVMPGPTIPGMFGNMPTGSTTTSRRQFSF